MVYEGPAEKTKADCHCRQTAFSLLRSGPRPCYLRGDGDAVLDVIKHVFWHHILSHQLALHFVRTVAYDSVGNILRDSQRKDQLSRRGLIDIQHRWCWRRLHRSTKNRRRRRRFA